MASARADVERWWLETAKADLALALPKAAEYGGAKEGSADLEVMGDALAVLVGLEDAPSAVRQELACWFYALGKVSRLISDYRQGRPGKSDSWTDLVVYAMMARRLQAVSRWP